MSEYFATTALLPNGDLKKVQLEDFHGKYVLLIFYPGDFTELAKSELLAFSEENARFENNDCQVHLLALQCTIHVLNVKKLCQLYENH